MRRQSSPDSEIEKRREAWKIQQEKERQHERLKRKKIEEYERKRAEKLRLNRKSSERRSRSVNRSRSRCKESQRKSGSTSRTISSSPLSDKVNILEGNRPFSKDPEVTLKFDENELRLIKIKIHRNIPASTIQTNEIRREILNPELIKLKRREGEGSKPLFDREELKNSQAKEIEVEERRVVEAVSKTNKHDDSYSTRRSTSSSPHRHRSSRSHTHHRSHSPSRRARSNEYSKQHSEDHYRHSSREDSQRKSSRAMSRSRDREHYNAERGHLRSRRSENYRDIRKRSRDRSHERHDRWSSPTERRSSSAYVEQIPVPVYYGGFPPQPMPIRPCLPLMRPPMIGSHLPGPPPCGPFPPRFPGPQNMFRGMLPSNSHDNSYSTRRSTSSSPLRHRRPLLQTRHGSHSPSHWTRSNDYSKQPSEDHCSKYYNVNRVTVKTLEDCSGRCRVLQTQNTTSIQFDVLSTLTAPLVAD